ncbi:NACHT domain-containing protein [Asanoa iriomotensis]|uniref:NACHT domain-containing protein n=1 Tax=Asanoa iriomotensis TaxID=234613 RepID=A0ABQ4C3T1_9ACTN|nr:NACHT domain-containing protein [Asanoa iriomotensis]GIF57420.1 hypothetical protein Air01nite_35150 [Asanoa iriomotensis]
MREDRGLGSPLVIALRSFALTSAVALLINLVSSKAPVAVPAWVWIALLVVFGAASVVVDARERTLERPVGTLQEVLDLATIDLSAAVADQWRAEGIRLQLYPAARRLPISWTSTPSDGFSSWARVLEVGGHAASRHRPDPAHWALSYTGLRGSGPDLARIWLRRVPSRRLVVLGEVGSGKTELLITLINQIFDEREPESGQLVPVLLPASSWDPSATDFASWVAEWLATSYSFLSVPAPGSSRRTLARALLDEGRVAIIVDGLDELPAALAAKAVERLSSELRPGQYLLVSSRHDPYFAAVADGPLDGAVGVVLDAQDPEQVLDYLARRSDGNTQRWDPVAAAVRQREAIADVLRTPLMVMLVDAIYNDQGRPGPAELLAETDAAAIEDRLLDGFLNLRYPDDDHQRWSVSDVRRWLGYLAAESLVRPDSVNLAWWDLPVAPASKRTRERLTYVVTPLLALTWTAVSAALMYSLLLNDLNRGLTNAARIGLAAVAVYAALLYLSRNYRAALVAVLGAYIAGIMSGSYDLAVVAGLAAGLCWQPLRLVRTGLRPALTVGAVVAAPPVLIRVVDGLSALRPERSLVQGFGGGFADGWVNRWDPDWNGFIGIYAIAVSMTWIATRLFPRSPCAVDRPFHLFARWRTTSPGATAVVVGVLVMILGLLADGHQDDVVHGWMLAPADGFAVGFLIWYLATWSARVGVRRAGASLPLTRSVLIGVSAGLFSFLALNGRSDVPNPWANALADAVLFGLLTWFLVAPPRLRPDTASDHRPVGLLDGTRFAGPAIVVGVLVGALDVLSAGAAGVAYGVAGCAIVLYGSYRRSDLWRRRTPDATGHRGPAHWAIRPEEVGVVVTVLVGVVAGFAYAIVYGVTSALAVKVSLEIHARRRPSTGLRASRAGVLGGAVLGSMVAFGASFSRIGPQWALLIGVTSAAAAIVAFGTEGKPAPENLVLSPRRLLDLDRWAFLRTTVGLAVTVGLAAGTWTMAVYGPAAAVLATISTTATYGVSAGLVVAAAQCRYGHYSASRLWLAADQKLPWRLQAFLDDAYTIRGVLRRNGAVYQFRHERLQGRLAQGGRHR